MRDCCDDILDAQSCEPVFDIKVSKMLFALICAVILIALSMTAESQLPALSLNSSSAVDRTRSTQSYGAYERPTQRTEVNNYLFDAFGPYPIVGSAFVAGINQAYNTPPEWNQGVDGYSKRLASNYGIGIVATTTRYGLSEVFKEDALYYRCECTGLLPRLRHALLSTLTARRGEDGHSVFSVPALVGPYAGTMVAAYGWYPNRFGAKDAFRAGNYSLLAFAGQDLSLEFIHSGPHSLLSRMHLNNKHGAPTEGPNK
jgi:hypothetical protein